VAAPELEALVVDAVRRHVQADSTASSPIVETDCELIEWHLLRATLSMTAITLHLRQDIAEASGRDDLPAGGSRRGGHGHHSLDRSGRGAGQGHRPCAGA